MRASRCPLCGQPRRMHIFAVGEPMQDAPVLVSRYEVARAPAFVPDVVVPLGRAVSAGLVVAPLGFAVGHLLNPSLAWGLGAVVAGAAALAQWYSAVRAADMTLWHEDTQELPAATAPAMSDTRDGERDGSRMVLVRSAPRRNGLDPAFVDFVRGCAVHGTAQNYWEARGIGREQYVQWRDTLIRLGWARWRNAQSPRSGWELCYSPDEILRGIGGAGCRPPRRSV